MPTIPESDPIAAGLLAVIRHGDTIKLAQLLSARPDLANTGIIDDNGTVRTPIHIVSDWPGHFANGAQTVAMLVAAGADPDTVVINASAPETALHWAASSNDVAVLDALLDAGADIEAPGAVFTDGTAMSDAVVFANWDAARRLLERGAKTDIWQAAALGLLPVVQQQIADQPALAPEQITNAFCHACRGGQLAMAECLLEHGAYVNWIGYNGRTPLDAARESGQVQLIAWLEGLSARSGQS